MHAMPELIVPVTCSSCSQPGSYSHRHHACSFSSFSFCVHLFMLEQGEVKQEAWKSALSRARGEKVLDDPKLLRK